MLWSGGGEVGEVGSSVGAQQQVVARGQEEVVVIHEVAGEYRGQRRSVSAITTLLKEREVGLVVQVGEWGVLGVPAPRGEEGLQVVVFGEVVAHLPRGFAGGGCEREAFAAFGR